MPRRPPRKARQQGCRGARSDHPAVVGPVQQCLPLPPATALVPRPAGVFHLCHMASHPAPAADLTLIVLHAPAHVVAAVPLEPAARVGRVNPAFFSPHGQRLRGIDAEVVEPRVTRAGRKPRVPEPRAGEFRRSVGHVLPSEHAQLEHFPGAQLRLESGCEVLPDSFGAAVAVASLHYVIDADDSARTGHASAEPPQASSLPARTSTRDNQAVYRSGRARMSPSRSSRGVQRHAATSDVSGRGSPRQRPTST
jgi:hypothetical protein